MTWQRDFEVVFNPRTIAVVGASEGASATRMQGATFMRHFLKLGFSGKIYPVNPKVGQVLGLPTFPDLVSIPEPIDLVIISVPAGEVPAVLEDCIAARAKNVHIYTAGFSETGEKEGKELEEKVREIALKGGLRVIGPNGMGVNVPAVRMMTLHDAPLRSGPVSFISQSGGHASMFTRYARGFGIGFSKIISYGNGCVMDCTDFLEYFAEDQETRIITMYLEGVKDGQKLMSQVRKINPLKPVIVWKGGLTEGGAKAVASHTGSLAGSEAAWSAFFQQTGAIAVNSLDELTDVTMTFVYFSPPPSGRRVALFMGGGGHSVSSADFCSREGLEVPLLSQETREKLRTFIPVAGTSIKNPLDAELILRRLDLLEQALKIVSADPVVDILMVNLYLDVLAEEGGKEAIRKMEEVLCAFGQTSSKPLVVIPETWGGDSQLNAQRARLHQEFLNSGIAVYRTVARAARAVAKFTRYHQFRRGEL